MSSMINKVKDTLGSNKNTTHDQQHTTTTGTTGHPVGTTGHTTTSTSGQPIGTAGHTTTGTSGHPIGTTGHNTTGTSGQPIGTTGHSTTVTSGHPIGTTGHSTTGTSGHPIGTTGHSTTGTTGTTTGIPGTHTESYKTGPVHNSAALNKVDPRVHEHKTTTTSGGARLDPTDASHVPPSVMQQHIGAPTVEHDFPHDSKHKRHSVSHQEDHLMK